VDWAGVFLFYLLACAFSWPFFWWRDMQTASWEAWRLPTFLKTSTYMWGPGLAALALLGLRQRRQPRTITFFGSSPAWSIAFFVVPIIALACVYAPIVRGRAALIGVLGLIGFFNILGEELGWRGYLQDALRPLSRVWRYVAIGALWEFWHFTNRTHGQDLSGMVRVLAFSYPIVIALAAIFGEAADRSRSLTVAVTLHFWVDALFEIPRLVNGPTWPTYAVLGTSLVFWAAILWK
jgi:MYXO-CTERM domain-containing protein